MEDRLTLLSGASEETQKTEDNAIFIANNKTTDILNKELSKENDTTKRDTSRKVSEFVKNIDVHEGQPANTISENDNNKEDSIENFKKVTEDLETLQSLLELDSQTPLDWELQQGPRNEQLDLNITGTTPQDSVTVHEELSTLPSLQKPKELPIIEDSDSHYDMKEQPLTVSVTSLQEPKELLEIEEDMSMEVSVLDDHDPVDTPVDQLALPSNGTCTSSDHLPMDCDQSEHLPTETEGMSSYSDSTQVVWFDYQLETLPRMVVETRTEFMKNRDNYFRGCKWSPDGTCLLTCNNDCSLRLFNLPPELYTGVPDEVLPELVPAVVASEGEIIYDFCWFPVMSSYDLSTCCFISCSRCSPVHLWDAYDGHLRCSYLAYNHLEEMVTPHSLCFNSDGTKLYTGFQNCIRIYDTGRPGRQYDTKTTYDRKNGGQGGIISCIAVSPTTRDTYALGSFSGSVGLYSDLVKGAIFVLQSLRSGVTHLMFSCCGNYIYTGERKNSDITVWDIRYPDSFLYQFQRTVTTNQRIYFDISKNGQYLVSGNTNGRVDFWALSLSHSVETEMETLSSSCQIQAHDDAVNGCSLHPILPLLATSSGQWTFPQSVDSEDEEDTSNVLISYDNSLKIWSLMGQTTGQYNDLLNE